MLAIEELAQVDEGLDHDEYASALVNGKLVISKRIRPERAVTVWADELEYHMTMNEDEQPEARARTAEDTIRLVTFALTSFDD